jgi:hypothetical protein
VKHGVWHTVWYPLVDNFRGCGQAEKSEGASRSALIFLDFELFAVFSRIERYGRGVEIE